MRWRPLAAATSGIGAVVLALWAAGAPPIADPPVTIAVALLVAAAALALDDPAHALVAAAPVGFGRRSPTGWHGSFRPRSLASCRSDGSRAGSTWCRGPADPRCCSGAGIDRRSPRTCSSHDGDPTLPHRWRRSCRRYGSCWGSRRRASPASRQLAQLWLDHPWTVCAAASSAVAVAVASAILISIGFS